LIEQTGISFTYILLLKQKPPNVYPVTEQFVAYLIELSNIKTPYQIVSHELSMLSIGPNGLHVTFIKKVLVNW